MESIRYFWEFASFVVTALGLPCALLIFMLEQEKERENEEEEGFQLISDAYNKFLQVVLENSDLGLRSQEQTRQYTPDQVERVLVIYDMLIALFERAYLVSWNESMTEGEARRWNSWDDYMRQWCQRSHFAAALPELLRGEDPGFTRHIMRIARDESADLGQGQAIG